MEESTKQLIIVGIGLLLFTTIITTGVYLYRNVEIQNFQITIKDLSEEQKCIHICGFEFHDFFEKYKFCVEKCDRISERLTK